MALHMRRVRHLYKIILKLHRGLPPDLKVLGDAYVKDEFRRHKLAEMEISSAFLTEWAEYAKSLAKQLGNRQGGNVGLDLNQSQLEFLREEQLGQLFELKQVAQSNGATTPIESPKEPT